MCDMNNIIIIIISLLPFFFLLSANILLEKTIKYHPKYKIAILI